MKLLESTKIKITKSKNGKNILNSEITEAVLIVYYNIVNSNCQQNSRVLQIFLRNKLANC